MIELKEKIREALATNIPFETDRDDMMQLLHMVMFKYSRYAPVLLSEQDLREFESCFEGCEGFKFEMGITHNDMLGLRMVPVGRSLN